MYGVCIGEIKKVYPSWNLSKNQSLISPFHDLRTENKQRILVVYIIADKMINDCIFDFDNFGILILQIPIASFDM